MPDRSLEPDSRTPAFEVLESRILLDGSGPPQLVSLTETGLPGNGPSTAAAISADGRFVAFASEAENLVEGDENAASDVFVVDRLTGQLTCCSAEGYTGLPSPIRISGPSTAPTISDDGRYVAFLSYNEKLTDDDGNGIPDVFVYDTTTGELQRVTHPIAGTMGILSGRPALSGDGAFVAVEYMPMSGPYLGSMGIWRIDLADLSMEPVVAIGYDGTPLSGPSYQPAISDDGQRVAFVSAAANVAPNDTNGAPDVFVRDMQAGTAERVSLGDGGHQADRGAGAYPDISGDGRYVAFVSSSTDLVAAPADFGIDIYLRDTVAGTTERISTAAAGAADGECMTPSLSGDGRFVAFISTAGNLVAADTNGQADVFLVDRHQGTVSRLSDGPGGVEAEDDSAAPAISADGGFVAFESWADNLVDGDANATVDVFVAAAAGPGGTADLTVDLQAYPQGYYHPGDSLTPALVLTNLGDGSAPGGFAIQLVLSLDETRGNADDILVGQWIETDPLGPGAGRTVMESATLPPDAARGSYYLMAIVDADDVVPEGAGEFNNTALSASAGVVVIPAGYTVPVITSVTSSRDPDDPQFQDPMRYIAGPEVPEVLTTFTAELDGAAETVSFSVGGVTVVDDEPADGFTAEINMSQLAAPGPLVVVADGVSQAYSFDVDLLMLPEWFQKDEISYAARFQEEVGYVFDLEVRDVNYGFFTPDSWTFSDPVFGFELIDFAHKWTGFWAGSRFQIISDIEGNVTPGPISYGLHVEVLSWTVYDRFIELSRSKSFSDEDEDGYGDADTSSDDAEASDGSFNGSLTGELIFSFSDDLDWEGAAGRITLAMDYSRDFTFFTMRYPIYTSVPGLLDAVVGGGMTISLSLGASLVAQLDSESVLKMTDIGIFTSATIAPKVFVGVEALCGLLGQVHSSLFGALTQEISFEWDGELGFDIAAPGALDLGFEISGGLLLDLFHWSKSWTWRVAQWDFFANDGDDVVMTEDDPLTGGPHVLDVVMASDGHGNALAVSVYDDPTDPSGHRHDLRVRSRTALGDIWGPTEPLTASSAVESSPAVAYDAAGVPYVVWVQGRTDAADLDTMTYEQLAAEQDLRIARYDAQRESWQIEALTDDAYNHGAPAIAFAPGSADGVAVWERAAADADLIDVAGQEIVYRSSDGAAWAPVAALTDNGYAEWGAQVAYTGDNRPVVVWLGDEDEDRTVNRDASPSTSVHAAAWNVATEQWDAATLVADGQASNQYVKLVRTPDGAVEAFWVSFDGRRYSLCTSRYDGTQWSAVDVVLADWTFIGEPSVTVDEDGRVCVLYTGMEGMQFNVYRIDRASPWSPPRVLTRGGWAASKIAAVAELGGTLAVQSIFNGGFSDPTASTSYLDPDGSSAGGLVALALTPRLTQDDAFATAEDTAVISGDLLANDVDAGADLTVIDYTQGGHGAVAYNGAGAFTYTPAADFNGTDAFTYTVVDSSGREDAATVTVTVAALNDRPAADAIAADVAAGEPGTIALNGSDVETAMAGLFFEIVVAPQHGQVSLADHVATYTPDAGYEGADSFSYTVLDRGDPIGVDALTSDPAVVSITIAPALTSRPGDADCDGDVDLDDFVVVKLNFGRTGATWAQGDFDGNGTVDLDDFMSIKQNFGPGKSGDADGDGDVDLDDFLALKQNFGRADARWPQGDFDANGAVDLDDFGILKQNFGTRAAPVDSLALMIAARPDPEAAVWMKDTLGPGRQERTGTPAMELKSVHVGPQRRLRRRRASRLASDPRALEINVLEMLSAALPGAMPGIAKRPTRR